MAKTRLFSGDSREAVQTFWSLPGFAQHLLVSEAANKVFKVSGHREHKHFFLFQNPEQDWNVILTAHVRGDGEKARIVKNRKHGVSWIVGQGDKVGDYISSRLSETSKPIDDSHQTGLPGTTSVMDHLTNILRKALTEGGVETIPNEEFHQMTSKVGS